MRRGVTIAAVAFALAALPATACGQRIPRSQPSHLMQMIGHTRFDIRYSRPVARGRDLFPGVVRYGRAWTPGADTATSIEFDTPVVFAGQLLQPGRYSLWAIPDADAWTLIFSSRGQVFHIPYPGEEYDVLRLTLPVSRGEHMETLTWHFPTVDGTRGTLSFHWGTVIVDVPVEVEGG